MKRNRALLAFGFAVFFLLLMVIFESRFSQGMAFGVAISWFTRGVLVLIED